MANPTFFLFVLNIVEVIYFVNYQCCRHFHRNPVLAPTSKLSFGALSSCFTFLSGNQRPKDRTGEMGWMGNITNQTRRSLWHVNWEHPSVFPLPTLPCQIIKCPKHRRAVSLGFCRCWFNFRPAVWIIFWNWSRDPGPEVSDWERWMGLHFGAYIDGQVGSLESCSASLTSRVELAVNFTLTTAGGVLIPSLENSILKGGESNHSFFFFFG